MAPSLNDGAMPVDSTSEPSGLEPPCIGAPVHADVAFQQNERALDTADTDATTAAAPSKAASVVEIARAAGPSFPEARHASLRAA